MTTDLTWDDFTYEASAIAEAGMQLLHQFGIGLAFIATTRKDGGPRLHPCCPLVADGHLYVFITGASPKRHDLMRDGRFALHSFPPAQNDDEFFCAGSAHEVDDATVRRVVAAKAKHNVRDDEVLFELRLDRALHTTWVHPRQPNTYPVHTKWRRDA
jgi:hypothetical protein